MLTLKSLINPSLKKRGIDKQVYIAQMLVFASEELARLLDDSTHALAQPAYIKNHTLTVRCSHSMIAQEIKFKEQKLLEALNNHFPGMSIKCVHAIC